MKLTENQIRYHLDHSIAYWRKIRDDAEHEKATMAPYYIDAFQSMRTSIFGEIYPNNAGIPDIKDYLPLPLEKKEPVTPKTKAIGSHVVNPLK